MNKTSMLEIIMLSIAVTVSPAVLYTPYYAAQIAGQDAWISVLVSGLLAIIPAWAAFTLMARFPRMSIIQVLPKLLGTVPGFLAALLFAGFFLFSAALAVWRLEIYTVRFLLTETPQVAVRALFLIFVACAALGGSIPLVRVSAYVVPLGMVIIFLVTALPIPKMDASFLFPLFERGLQPMLYTAVFLLGWLCQVPVVLLMFQRYVPEKFSKGGGRKALLAVLMSTLAMELGALGSLASFGPRQTATMYYSSFEVARIIAIGPFLERIEIIFVGVWIAGIFITAAFYLQAFVDSLADIFSAKGKYTKVLFISLTTLVLILWPQFIELSFFQVIAIIRNYASSTGIIFGGILPVLLLMRVALFPINEKNRKSQGSGSQLDNDEQKDESDGESEQEE